MIRICTCVKQNNKTDIDFAGMDVDTQNPAVRWFIATIPVLGVVCLIGAYVWMAKQYRKNYWHHGVRLPSQPQRIYWYMVTVSIGCRPWAGHEGDVFIRLIGSRGESRTFLLNGEIHSRLYEAESHVFLYASAWPLGEIDYVIVACGATQRRKRWHLSSIQVKYVAKEGERERCWYFPYHEWIEVFLEPVKVTLCGVDPNHDLNKRLLLGWLSRGVSDFHIWLSMFGPLKYTRFRRSERLLCAGTHIVTSVATCVLMNGWMPNLGPFVLGVYSSAGAALPAYVAEWCLRQTERRPKVVMEDMAWYEGDLEGGWSSPIVYDQYMLSACENYDISAISCGKFDQDADERLREFESYKDIMNSDRVFWKWLTAGSLAALPSIPSLNADSFVTATDGDTVASHTYDDVQRSETDAPGSGGIFSKLKAAVDFIKRKLTGKGMEDDVVSDSDDDIVDDAVASLLDVPLESLIDATNVSDANLLEAKLIDDTEEDGDRRTCLKSVMLAYGKFSVDPTSVWKVDSEFSISSLSMEGVDLNDFKLLESMPVADFDLLRKGKRPLLQISGLSDQVTDANAFGAGTRFGRAEGEIPLHRKLVKKVSAIVLPSSADHLTIEEGELVSMVYFDLNTGGRQWSKGDVPDAVYTSSGTNVVPSTDWMKMDMSSLRDFDDWNPIDFKGRGDDDMEARMNLLELRQKYPEPIPRQRVFSVLMFKEYSRKLADAYDHMTSFPEMHSCLAEMFAAFAESEEGPKLFAEACMTVAPDEDGRQALRHVLSSARRSTAWTSLICDVTQRLRFQGDNVERIKEKYGLEMMCKIAESRDGFATIKPTRCFESDCSETSQPPVFAQSEARDEPNKCVYYEFDRMISWSRKLNQLRIPKKDCPLGELPDEDLRRLSRFYRAMLLSEDGCILFGELLLQVTASGKEGCSLIARVIRFVTSQNDGVERLIAFHRQLGVSGPNGRRILLRLYNAVKGHPPHGHKVLKRLADHLSEVPMGKILISDLQVDALKAHAIAREIRREIQQSLNPLVKRSRRNLCHVILRMNEMAQCVLTAADHARAVLEDEGEFPFMKKGSVKSTEESDSIDSVLCSSKPDPESLWKSARTCCRNYKELAEELNAAKEETPPPPKESDHFRWSPSSSDLSCEVPATPPPPKTDLLVSELWEPLDERKKVNIYKQEEKEEEEVQRPCDGFEPPCCKRLDYCDARVRSGYNEFYLQTKDYEKFYMSFSYRSSGVRKRIEDIQRRLGGFGAQAVRSDSSLAWDAARAAARRDAYDGLHNKHTDLPDVAAKWGRKVVIKEEDGEGKVEDGGEETYKHPCICTHDGKSQFGCLICSIARQISDAENPDDVIDIITDQCQDAPRISTTHLPPFPQYEDVVLSPQKLTEVTDQTFTRKNFKNSLQKEARHSRSEENQQKIIQATAFDLEVSKSNEHELGGSNTDTKSSETALRLKQSLLLISTQSSLSTSQSSGSLVSGATKSTESSNTTTNVTAESSATSNEFGTTTSDSTSVSDNTTSKSASYEDTSTDKTPFPSAGCCGGNKLATNAQHRGYLKEPACPCTDGKPKPSDLPLTKRNLAMYTKAPGDYKDAVYKDTNENVAGLETAGCTKGCGGKMSSRSPRPWPITAQNFNKAEEVKVNKERARRPISTVVAKALQLQMDKSKADESNPQSEYDINAFTSPVVPSRKADVEHWAKDRMSDSEFSRPDLERNSIDEEYCVICGGVVTTNQTTDLPFAYRYLVNHEADARQQDGKSATTIWSQEPSLENKSSTHSDWDRARGCCGAPGCINKPPDGARYRNLREKERREREERYWKERNRIQNEINNRYQQWHPPGRHSLANAADKDELDIVDVEPTKAESFLTAPTCQRSDGSITNSVDSMDRLVRAACKKPVTTRKHKLKMFRNFLDETCDLHKLPRFACCRLHDATWARMKENKNRNRQRLYANAPLSCICNSNESLSGDFHTAVSSFSKPHSICSECHIRIGTQQSPPCTRYLLPLRAVRCYEEAILKYEQAPSMTTDSGLSLDTAFDVINDDDINAVHPTQQQTLMDLMGLSRRQNVKLHKFAGRASAASSFISVGSSTPSSGVCCHVDSARQLPLLHLQGFGCDPAVDYFMDANLAPLPLDWWKRHDVALRSAQECVDACVRLNVLVAQTKSDAITDHERTCKVCGPRISLMTSLPDEDGLERIGGAVLGPRYSEMLPTVWRPTVREQGRKEETERRRSRFYRELIQVVVESTRVLLLTPDLLPPKKSAKVGSRDREDESEDEARVTTKHVTKIAHFRAMTKALNGLLKKVLPIKVSKTISPDDVTAAARMTYADDFSDDVGTKPTNDSSNDDGNAQSSETGHVTILESLVQFVKSKMCGSVEDCREVLENPWEFPVKAQHVAGKLLVKIISNLNNLSGGAENINPLSLDDALEATIDAFLCESVFRATTQTCIQRAVRRATEAKQYLAYLECITRLCVAKLIRYSEMVDAAIVNTRKVVKGCLEAVEEKGREREFTERWWMETEGGADASDLHKHISSILRSGRDDGRSTLDDVLIGFERLRRHVRHDLTFANQEVTLIGALLDEEAMKLFEGTTDKPERKLKPAYDAWTESEVALKERPEFKEKPRDDITVDDVVMRYVSSESFTDTDETVSSSNKHLNGDQASSTDIGATSGHGSHDAKENLLQDDVGRNRDQRPPDSAVDDVMHQSVAHASNAGRNIADFSNDGGSTESLKHETVIERETRIAKEQIDSIVKRAEDGGIERATSSISNVDVPSTSLRPTAGPSIGYCRQLPSRSIDDVKSDEYYSDVLSTDAMSYVTCPSQCTSTCASEDIEVKNKNSLFTENNRCKTITDVVPEDFIKEDSAYAASVKSDSSFVPMSIEPTSSSVFSTDEEATHNPTVRFANSVKAIPAKFPLLPSAGVREKTNYQGNATSNESTENAQRVRKKMDRSYRFGSVFAQHSAEELVTDDHTKQALRTNKGRNMLQEIFGRTLTPRDMINSFHGNIRALIDMQNGGNLPHWTSAAVQTILLLLCLVAAGFSCYSAIFIGLYDHVLIWAVLIAIFTFGFILEPLKCIALAWLLFLWRYKPAFYNSPLFIKSNPALMKRASAIRPSTCGYINRKDYDFYERNGLSAFEYEEGLYRRYCENRSRPGCSRHQKRVLPALGESDISLDLEKVEPYAEIDEARANVMRAPSLYSEISEPEEVASRDAISGFRRHAFDAGTADTRGGFRRGGVDVGGGKRKRKPPSPPPSEAPPTRTKIVWCNFATAEDGRPTSSHDDVIGNKATSGDN